MPEYARALIYILGLSIPVFFVAEKIAGPLVDKDEFRRWRNCWIATTFATFLSSSFLAFVAMILLVSVYIHRCAKQPIFFYIILMFVAPCVSMGLGIPGVFNSIIELNPPKLLALLILLPIAHHLWMDAKNRQATFLDTCIVSYYVLLSALSWRYGLSSVLRGMLGYFTVILLPYFVFSRGIRSAKDLNRALLAFAVAAMPLAAVGAFEMRKGWRLYNQVVQQWEVIVATPYLLRDSMLRASATAIEPIAFGFACMAGIGCLMTLRTRLSFSKWTYVGLGILLVGLMSSLSRGPWLGSAVFAFVALAAYPKTALKVLVCAMPLVAGAAYAWPARFSRFIDLLPFIGSSDPGSEAYRSDLLANALIVIQRYPFFGSLTFLEEPEMQRMIQGQGIIDVVNSYLQIALEFGLVGLFLFVIFFLTLGASLFTRAASPTSHEPSINYAGLFALLVAMLFTIVTVSSVSVIPSIYWAFAGICAALPRLRREVIRTPALEMRVLSGFRQ